jgi:hypothetical protein
MMLLRRTVFALLAFVVAGCGEPLRVQAGEAVISANLSLFSLSSAPPTYPSAISTPFAQGVPANATGNFDVALDLTSDGRIVVMPVATVVVPLTGPHSVGLLRAGTSFEAVTSAPVGTYVRDTVMTIDVGEVVVIEANRSRTGDICSFALSPFIYSKLVVIDADLDTGLLTVRLTADPNCGFRSFAEGIPRD